MKIDLDDIAEALSPRIWANARQLREMLGLSHRDAAKLCSAVGYPIPHTFIYKLETGGRTGR